MAVMPVLAGVVPLRDLLDIRNFKFHIPSYQRHYEWSEQACTTLVRDLEALLTVNGLPGSDGPQVHILGNVVLMQTKFNPGVNSRRGEVPSLEFYEQHGPRFVDIVDGQQRITTLVMLHDMLHTWLIHSLW
jgi:uncharacterized protein with ParB-like and HNH nuclease domain